MPRMKSVLRAVVVLTSLGLLIGCVWFAQKQAAPAAMPGSKSGILTVPAKPSSPAPVIIMSGSKSFTGGSTISSGVLQLEPAKPPLAPKNE